MFEFEIQTKHKTEFVEITGTVNEFLQQNQIQNGICIIYCRHTTAGVLTNENADGGAIWKDISEMLERMAPENKSYHHDDGNAHAHLKTALIGNSKTLLVKNGQLVLGTWEGVYLAEFDGPRKRHVFVQFVSSQNPSN